MVNIDTGLMVLGPAVIAVSESTDTGSVSLNDADNSIATKFECKKDGIINRIIVHIASRVGTPPTYNVGIVTLNPANSEPTSTPAGGSAIKEYNFNSTGIHTITLDTPANVLAGEMFAARIWPTASAPSAGNYVSVSRKALHELLPKGAQYASSWTHTSSISLGVLYNDGDVVCAGTNGTSSIISIDTGTDPDEWGALFTLPYGVICVGVCVSAFYTFSGDVEIILYDNNNNVLASQIIDNNHFPGLGYNGFSVRWSPVTLQANQNYRIICKPLSASNISVHSVFLQGNHRSDPRFSLGNNFSRTQRVNGGAWNNSDEIMPLMGLLITRLIM